MMEYREGPPFVVTVMVQGVDGQLGACTLCPRGRDGLPMEPFFSQSPLMTKREQVLELLTGDKSTCIQTSGKMEWNGQGTPIFIANDPEEAS